MPNYIRERGAQLLFILRRGFVKIGTCQPFFVLPQTREVVVCAHIVQLVRLMYAASSAGFNRVKSDWKIAGNTSKNTYGLWTQHVVEYVLFLILMKWDDVSWRSG
jgi:hypothetical protein